MTNITILNLRNLDTIEYAFSGWHRAKEQFKLSDYRVVYTGSTNSKMLRDEDYIDVCEEMFARTNVPGAVPLDEYYGHSMSVSDVVIISSVNGMRAYYCDTFGWHRIDTLKVVGCMGV